MDKRITFRFYNVVRSRHSRFDFGNALMQIANIPRRRDREVQLGVDYHARAEIIDQRNGAIVGEMTRIQRTNFPAEIQGDDRTPLQTPNPLGHGVVFRFLPGTGQLGVQYEPRVLSPGRFAQYIADILEGAQFDLEPIVREDMWDRFQQAPVRKVSIAIARPADIARLDRGPAAAAVTSIKAMAEAYEAPKINIEMSMGRVRRGGLADDIKAVVAHFRRDAVQEVCEVLSLKGKIKEVGERPEEIDLLDDIGG